MIGRQGRVGGTRELVVQGTPYIVVYRVHDDVEILAVVHGARKWPESFA
jgi:toxin ParE1/3/4